MTVVLDANAAIDFLLDGRDSARLAAILKSADEIIAPDLLFVELANAIGKMHRFKNLSLYLCDFALQGAEDLLDRAVPCRELYRDAFALARTSQRSAYDMLYLALARREAATLLTLDASLKKEAEHQGIPTA